MSTSFEPEKNEKKKSDDERWKGIVAEELVRQYLITNERLDVRAVQGFSVVTVVDAIELACPGIEGPAKDDIVRMLASSVIDNLEESIGYICSSFLELRRCDLIVKLFDTLVDAERGRHYDIKILYALSVVFKYQDENSDIVIDVGNKVSEKKLKLNKKLMSVLTGDLDDLDDTSGTDTVKMTVKIGKFHDILNHRVQSVIDRNIDLPNPPTLYDAYVIASQVVANCGSFCTMIDRIDNSAFLSSFVSLGNIAKGRDDAVRILMDDTSGLWLSLFLLRISVARSYRLREGRPLIWPCLEFDLRGDFDRQSGRVSWIGEVKAIMTSDTKKSGCAQLDIRGKFIREVWSIVYRVDDMYDSSTEHPLQLRLFFVSGPAKKGEDKSDTVDVFILNKSHFF